MSTPHTPDRAHEASVEAGPGLAAEALATLERLVREKPAEPFPALSDVMRRLVATRDALIARRRTEHEAGTTSDVSTRLTGLNAVISVVAGAQFPMAGIKRDRIEKAREALARWLEQRGEGDGRS